MLTGGSSITDVLLLLHQRRSAAWWAAIALARLAPFSARISGGRSSASGFDEQARDQRTQHEEDQRQRGQDERQDFADADEVELVEIERAGRGAAIQRRVRAGEGGAFDRDNVAALAR